MKGVQENIPLAPFTTLGIGGPARFLTDAATEERVLEAVEFARSRSLPVLILGGGSNLLVSDDGFPGVVIRMALEGVQRTEDDAGACLTAGAGVAWDGFVEACVEQGLFGVECLSGIPGLVGATPVQNVGAYGQEVADVIASVRVYDRQERRLRELGHGDCRFGYRSSIFNTDARGRYIVLAVRYLLKKASRSPLSYPDLERVFRNHEGVPGLSEVRQAVLGIRLDKAMLLVDGDPDCRSAGSFFRNPTLPTSEFDRLREITGAPGYPTGGGVKVPAAWLIERAGFPRGSSGGPVGLSGRHALAVINRGGATARDVLRFAGAIQDAVRKKFGIRLSTEPAFAGFTGEVVARFGAVVG